MARAICIARLSRCACSALSRSENFRHKSRLETTSVLAKRHQIQDGVGDILGEDAVSFRGRVPEVAGE